MPSTTRRSRLTQSSSRSSLDAPTTENIDRRVGKLINYVMQYSTSLAPIRFIDLLPFVDGDKATLKELLLVVVETLKDIHGILMTELKDTTYGKRYILSATSKPEDFELSPAQVKERTLLWIVLCFLAKCYGRVDEKRLQTYLQKIGIAWSENDEYFGNVKKLIDGEFVKQLFIKRKKEGPSGLQEAKIYYSWGERAEIEIDMKELSDSYAKILHLPNRRQEEQQHQLLHHEDDADDEEWRAILEALSDDSE